MIPTCPFCGSRTELAHNGGQRPGMIQPVRPSRHYRECSALDCRAQGPHRSTPEAANLAFLNRASYLRVAAELPPAHTLAGHHHE